MFHCEMNSCKLSTDSHIWKFYFNMFHLLTRVKQMKHFSHKCTHVFLLCLPNTSFLRHPVFKPKVALSYLHSAPLFWQTSLKISPFTPRAVWAKCEGHWEGRELENLQVVALHFPPSHLKTGVGAAFHWRCPQGAEQLLSELPNTFQTLHLSTQNPDKAQNDAVTVPWPLKRPSDTPEVLWVTPIPLGAVSAWRKLLTAHTSCTQQFQRHKTPSPGMKRAPAGTPWLWGSSHPSPVLCPCGAETLLEHLGLILGQSSPRSRSFSSCTGSMCVQWDQPGSSQGACRERRGAAQGDSSLGFFHHLWLVLPPAHPNLFSFGGSWALPNQTRSFCEFPHASPCCAHTLCSCQHLFGDKCSAITSLVHKSTSITASSCPHWCSRSWRQRWFQICEGLQGRGKKPTQS